MRTNIELEINIYPITIISDRYRGSYSGGKWIAWNLYPEGTPAGPDDGDCECHAFWLDNNIICGKGETADEAVQDLIKNLYKAKEV